MVILSVPRMSAEGDAEQLRVAVDQHELLVRQLQDRLVRRAGRPAPEVEADLRHGRVLSVEQAREYGLLDELL